MSVTGQIDKPAAPADASASQPPGFWERLMHGGRLLHRGSGVTLRLAFKLLVFFYFLFCVLFLGLRYVVLPNIDHYKSTVEKVATRAVGRPVAIGTIVASWHGLNPRLELSEVAIHNRMGEVALRLPRVSATLSWLSVPVAGLRLSSLEILRPDLEIERDADGALFVGGIYINPAGETRGGGLDWLLSQPEIVIRDGWLRWKDVQRQAPELVLGHMTVKLENHWLQHRLAIRATPPAEVGAPIDFRARFSHSAFAQRISDVSSWTGTVYVDWQQADLARGNTWLDYPVEIREGYGAVRAWLSFDHAAITDLTADLALTNLATRLRPDLGVLHLKEVSGRVAASENVPAGAQRLFNYGRRGHAITLQDFSFETQDGLKLPSTSISERYTEASGNKPAVTELAVAAADLQAIAQFASRLPLSADQHKLIEDLDPRGSLTNFHARWQGMFPDISAYQAKGDFRDLSLRTQALSPGMPGFRNLSGSANLNEQGGELRIKAEDAELHLPGLFAEPVFPLEEVSLSANWSMLPDRRVQLQVSNASFRHAGMQGTGSARYFSSPGHAGHLELQARVDEADVTRTGRYLPLSTPPDLAHWLANALQAGKLRDAQVQIKGNLDDFPFRTTRPGEKPKGQFSVNGRIVDGKIDYAPGSMAAKDSSQQEWPSIEKIQGKLSIDRARLEVQADSAWSHKVALAKVSAVVPDLMAGDATMLEVNGNAQGPLQELLGFTIHSPVGEWIGNFTDESRATGSARLGLNLQLPLHDLDAARVKGNLQFNNNEVTLFKHLPPLARTNGELRFNEKGFELSGIRAAFLGGPVQISGGTVRDGLIAVRAEGAASVEGLRRNYSTPSMQRLLQRLSGGARYTVQVNVRNERPEVIVESNLQGMGLDFPAPLKKANGEAMPLRIELLGLARDDSGAQRDELRASLGNVINARYQRSRVDQETDWKVLRGGIGVNVPAPQPDNGVVVNVNLRSLDLDAWRGTMTAIAGEAGPGPGAGRGAAVDASQLAQYIDPEVLAARAGELIIGNKKLDNVVVGASHADAEWQANIESSQVSGYLSWRESRSGRGRGRVTARLASLIVPPSAASDVSDLLEGKGAATQIPALDIVADNFELFGKKFGKLELQANNASTPEGREWRINKLSVVNPDATMSAIGSYASRHGQVRSSLNYQLDIADAGRLLDRLGFKAVLRGGRGRLAGEVSWDGLPFSLDIPSLSGKLEMDIAAGQFLKVDPGAAKLLGVLSLQSLPRRLTLDFRDVFSEGFAFDGASASATIEQGVMKTDSFKMRSVNAAVLMDGTVDLARESQNLHVVVIPEINAGAASVAYLIVNPVVGIGSFLAQLFLRDPLMRAFTMEYEIGGPWKDPTIRKLPRATPNAAPAPSAAPGNPAS